MFRAIHHSDSFTRHPTNRRMTHVPVFRHVAYNPEAKDSIVRTTNFADAIICAAAPQRNMVPRSRRFAAYSK
jgi:hypothetical protein